MTPSNHAELMKKLYKLLGVAPSKVTHELRVFAAQAMYEMGVSLEVSVGNWATNTPGLLVIQHVHAAAYSTSSMSHCLQGTAAGNVAEYAFSTCEAQLGCAVDLNDDQLNAASVIGARFGSACVVCRGSSLAVHWSFSVVGEAVPALLRQAFAPLRPRQCRLAAHHRALHSVCETLMTARNALLRWSTPI